MLGFGPDSHCLVHWLVNSTIELDASLVHDLSIIYYIASMTVAYGNKLW